ncbi:MAG: peptidylprolyl isomerase [Clostridiales Family XIII bacterium]|jgi:foldase protein PrsA|nr:peptidylprolyl isomerase [Clostridiales Family XIII bacterium]
MKNHDKSFGRGRKALSMALAAALAVSAALALSACGGEKGRDVVRVGDTVLTEAQLDAYTELMMAVQGIDFDTIPDESLREELRREAKLSMLDMMTEVEVTRLHFEGKDVMPEDFDEQVQGLIDSVNSDAQYGSVLRDRGVGDDTLRYFMEAQFLQQALADEVSEGLPEPTEQEIRDYYDENKDSLQIAEKRAVSHILVGSSEHKDEDRELIEDIRAKIAGGEESFEDMAREYSTDSSNSGNGGAMDPVERGTFVTEFDDAAFSLGVGVLSDVIETQFGFHILRVDEIQPAQAQALEDARESIVQALVQSATYGLFMERVTELMAEADIEYLSEDYPAPDEREAADAEPSTGAGIEALPDEGDLE